MKATVGYKAVLFLLILTALAQTGQAAENGTTKRINLEVRDVPLTQVIEQLFAGTGLSYTIEPGLQNRKISAVLKNVSFDVALREITRAAGIEYQVDTANGVYTFLPTPYTYITGMLAPPAIKDTNVKRIELHYIDPREVIAAIWGDPSGLPRTIPSGYGYAEFGPTQRSVLGSEIRLVGTGPSFIILSGAPEDLNKATEIINMLDTPDAYPRAVRIKLIANITVWQQNKPPKTYSVSSESVGIEGEPIPLNINVGTTKPDAPGRIGSGPRQSSNVHVTLVPFVDKQGKISISGSGEIRGDLPIHYEKFFEVAAAAQPDQKIVIASGSAELDDGSIEFIISIVPSIEKERVRRIGKPPQIETTPPPPGPMTPAQPGGPSPAQPDRPMPKQPPQVTPGPALPSEPANRVRPGQPPSQNAPEKKPKPDEPHPGALLPHNPPPR
ncbi:MAG: hypothetical protein ACUVRS_08665 [Armatimonadota bacterium]